MTDTALHPLNIFATAELLMELRATAIAPGFGPDATHDLSFRGGKTIANGTAMPFYVGDGWSRRDTDAIDGALASAFTDRKLESVMAQYFAAEPALAIAPSAPLAHPAKSLQQAEVESLAQQVFSSGQVTSDPASTLVCLLLAPGTRLFTSDGSDSFNGLGGYHGSVQSGSTTVYYAVGVYSETSGGTTNGIPAFPESWKNVVATFYHEINEWRTDPDVERATGSNANGVLGWYSQQYGEIGDIPITEAGSNLSAVFVEVARADGGGTVPVQLMYSNFDHGPAAETAAAPGSALPAS